MPCKRKLSEPLVASGYSRRPHPAAGGIGRNCTACLILREGDTIVVWKLDRLSRSLKDVLHIMERISNEGAGFR